MLIWHGRLQWGSLAWFVFSVSFFFFPFNFCNRLFSANWPEWSISVSWDLLCALISHNAIHPQPHTKTPRAWAQLVFPLCSKHSCGQNFNQSGFFLSKLSSSGKSFRAMLKLNIIRMARICSASSSSTVEILGLTMRFHFSCSRQWQVRGNRKRRDIKQCTHTNRPNGLTSFTSHGHHESQFQKVNTHFFQTKNTQEARQLLL